MCGRSFLISSDSYLFRTSEVMDKTPQKVEGKLIMMMDKAQETKIEKLAFQCFLLTSAKAKKFQDGN